VPVEGRAWLRLELTRKVIGEEFREFAALHGALSSP
jgi:hypothetical protein